jgi:ABC-2 type transport system permease protein
MNPLRLYFRLISLAIQTRLQYRADFVTGMLGVILWNVISLGVIGILITRFNSLNGWTLWEVVFLYCLWMLSHSTYSLLFWHIRQLEDYLIQGTFDQFLLRPASPFILFIGREVYYTGTADLTFGVVGIVLAFQHLQLQWGWEKWLFFGLAVIAGTLIEMTVQLSVSCLAFWTGRSRRATGLVMKLTTMIQNYPMDIYGYTFQVVVTGLIPVAFMNYYPSLWLLNKLNYQSPWWWLSYMSPVVALIMIGLTAGVWHLALRRYSSAGG